MPPTNPIDDPSRELLVAYLDGELADSDCEAIESRLATDDALREQLQGLDRVWNALDGLPRPTVNESFAKTTIEMAAVEAKQDVVAMTAAMPVARRRRGYAVAGACAGALLLGFALVRAAVTKPDRVLLTNLPVIYRVDTLQEFNSPDFLRRLPEVAEPLLATADSEQVADTLATWRAIDEGDRLDRADWVASLSESDKVKLLDSSRRYSRDLTATRREAVHGVYRAISAEDDHKALMQTALAYEDWLTKQPASEQIRLRLLSDDQRLEELRQIAKKTARENARSLSQEDSAALRRAIQALDGSEEIERARALGRAMIERVAAFAKQRVPEDQGDRVEEFRQRMIEGIDHAPPVQLVIRLAQLTSQGSRGSQGGRPRRGDEDQADEAAKVWGAIEARLVASLSQQAQANLARIEKPWQRRQLLVKWIQQAARDVMAIDLEEYFASDALTDRERHALLAMPSEAMQRRLREIYVERELGGGQFGGGQMGRGSMGPFPEGLRDIMRGRRGANRNAPPGDGRGRRSPGPRERPSSGRPGAERPGADRPTVPGRPGQE